MAFDNGYQKDWPALLGCWFSNCKFHCTVQQSEVNCEMSCLRLEIKTRTLADLLNAFFETFFYRDSTSHYFFLQNST